MPRKNEFKGIVIKALPVEEFIDAFIRGYILRQKPPRQLLHWKYIKKSDVRDMEAKNEIHLRTT